MSTVSSYERARYDRQIRIPGWGEEGQRRLKRSSVFIAGAGGLGSPASIYLAVAGVGRICICDADLVELSNLNRQILHTDKRLGQPKATSAGDSLTELNPSIDVVTYNDFISQDNIERIVGSPDVVVDCLDNFETRYLLNAYCVRSKLPLVYGAIQGMVGQATFLQPPETACLRCVFPEAPPKEVFPVVGTTPGVIGSIQAMEVVKFLAQMGTTLKGRLLLFDGLDMSFRTVKLRRDPSCPDCAHDLPHE